MADVKNFGLVGVGNNVQFGKAGSKIVLDAGTFKFRNAANAADVAITSGSVTSSGAISAATGITTTAGGVTASAGNLTATAGNLVLSSGTATIGIGGDTTISRQQAGVVAFDGAGAVQLPGSTGSFAGTPEAGMLRYQTAAGVTSLEYYDADAAAWQTIATGGNTGTLAGEIQVLRDSMGTMVDNTTGVWNSAALTSPLYGTTPSSLTVALNNLASNIALKDTFDELFPSTAIGNVIYSNGTNKWAQAAPGSTSGVQAYDAGLEALATKTSTGIIAQTGADTYTAVTVSASGGLTVADTTGTDGALAIGTTGNLAALNSMAGSGIAVRNSDGSWANKTISSANGDLTVTNGSGTAAGDISLNLAGNLAAVSGLTSVGFVKMTSGGLVSTGAITGTSGNIVVTNGDGNASNPTINLAEVTQADTGTFVKVTLDGYGRVTGNTAVTTGDITALVDNTYVNVSGDTMTGNLDFGGTHKVTGLAAPTAGGDAANKSYVDNAVAGMTWKAAANVLSATNVPLTGTSLVIDGDDVQDGYRIVLIGQTTAADNGIYVASVPTPGGAYTLTRAADADTYQELIGATIFIMEGTQYGNTGWTQSNHYLTSFAGQTWVQFSGAGAYSGSGAIDVTGTVISLRSGNGLTQTAGDNSNQLAINLAADTALQFNAGALTFVLASGGGLEQSASGLKISAGGVTNTMLANSSIGTDADTGTGTISLGGTLNIVGTSAQGISTSVSGGDFTITAANATTTSKGVASFSSASFDVASGAVSIKSGGVSNSQLANSTFTLSDGTATDAVALGETLTVTGTGGITTAVTNNALSIDLGTVAINHGGTGKTSFTNNQIHYGQFEQSATLSFDPAVGSNSIPTLTLGQTTIAGGTVANPDFSITAATGGDISLVPASGQSVVIAGSVGDSTIQSDAATALTIRGNTTLTLESGTGSTVMKLTSGTTNKVSVSGPTAADYATGLAANDLTNKQYVDQAIASGAAAGAIKAFTATVSGDGTTDIGSAMPAGATVLSVKLQVTTADSAATVTVGKSGSAGAYMSSNDNDPSATGLYLAETYVTEASATTATITVSGATTFAGKVIVQYQVAQ